MNLVCESLKVKFSAFNLGDVVMLLFRSSDILITLLVILSEPRVDNTYLTFASRLGLIAVSDKQCYKSSVWYALGGSIYLADDEAVPVVPKYILSPKPSG